MTTSGLLRLLRRHWLLALICALLGAAAGLGIANHVIPPSYSATVKLYVAGAGETASDRLQSGEYARSRVSSYADMASSAEVVNAVRENLGLPLTADGSLGDLATSITATNPLDTTVIDVTVRANSPQRAQQVAAAVGSVYDAVVSKLESPPDGKDSPARIAVASPPAVPAYRDGPSGRLFAAGGLVVGAAAGLGASWLFERRAGVRRRRRMSSTEPDSGVWSWGPVQGQDTVLMGDEKEVA